MSLGQSNENNAGTIDLESKNIFKRIKSTLILKNLLDSVYKKVSFGIIKYNKEAQNRLKLSLKDFEECSKLFSSVEIEIKPALYNYGKFINILKEEDKIHYHIFFNNDEGETRRRYIKKDEIVNKIRIIIGFKINSFEKLFYDCACIESINFIKFLRTTITNISYMFCGCTSLKELNLSNFITNNVTCMDSMFSRCVLIKELNLPNFNTKNVNDMTFMFSDCHLLEKLDLSNFNTSNVLNMSYMFFECSSLKELDLSNFSINNETMMNYMFSGCSYELKMKIQSQNKTIKYEAFLDE